MSPTQNLTRRKPHISKGSSRSCCQVPDGSANVCRLHSFLCRQTDDDSFKGKQFLTVAVLHVPSFPGVVWLLFVQEMIEISQAVIFVFREQ